MKTLKQRLHPQYRTLLATYSNNYPSLGERVNTDLNNLEFIGDLRLTVVIDMQLAFKLKDIAEIYNIFDEQNTNY